MYFKIKKAITKLKLHRIITTLITRHTDVVRQDWEKHYVHLCHIIQYDTQRHR